MAAHSPKRSIFRSKTLQKYRQDREKSVLPRVIAPPVFALCWIVCIFLIAAGVVVWLVQVPEYITGSGVVLDTHTANQTSNEATAVILLPGNEVSSLRSGLPVQMQIGLTGPVVKRSVDVVSQSPLSPNEVHQQYGLQVTDPSIVVTVGLGSTVPENIYSGSLVQAQIQIGSQSLFSLFPIISSLLKI